MIKTVLLKENLKSTYLDHFQKIIMFLIPFYVTLFYITIVKRLFASKIYGIIYDTDKTVVLLLKLFHDV